MEVPHILWIISIGTNTIYLWLWKEDSKSMNRIKIAIKKIIYAVFSLNKVGKVIVFESSPDYSDNTKELFMYMVNQGYTQKYKMIWFVEDKSKINLEIDNVYFLDYYGKKPLDVLRGLIYLSKSQFAFFSHRTPFLKPKRNQRFVNLWHGSGLKNTHFVDMSRNFDFVLNTSEAFNDPFINLLGCKKEQLLSFGNPRTDLFFSDNTTIKENFRQSYDKVIIWMPTYRKHKNGGRTHFLESEENTVSKVGLPIIQTIDDYNSVNQLLSELNILLVIKPHPAQDLSDLKVSSQDNIVVINNADLVEKNIDLYSFISISDALITDYSSVYVDYLLLDRPIAFTVDDMDLYESGFIFENPKDFMPGHNVKNLDDFRTFLLDCFKDNDEYIKDRKDIRNLLNKHHDGNVSKRIVDFLEI